MAAKDCYPSSDDLVLRVVEGVEPNVCDGTVNAAGSIELTDGWRLALRIMSASHTWTLFDGDGNPVVSEVFACENGSSLSDRPLLEERRETLFDASSFGARARRQPDLFQYTVQVKRMSLGEKPLRIPEGVQRVMYAFGEGEDASITEATVQSLNHGTRGFRIWTRHDYPHERAVVWTEGNLYSSGGVHARGSDDKPKAKEGKRRESVSIPA